MLRLRQPTHGYAVRRELLSWRAGNWTNVKPGSIYHALRQLAQEGKLSTLGSQGSDQGPGRTLFELTAAGETEFRRLMDAALVSVDMEELGAAIAFMDALPRAHVLEKLREQRRRSAEVRDQLIGMTGDFPGRYAPPHATDLLELWGSVFDNPAGWTGGMIERLEAGEYRMPD
ncbi:PadR family transcriptional regulator [Nocardia sp. NPDC052566]|uniref:PadR family transcriptional regulator n=1 Tax=Nocardia sp. NPDC052566 TaxID=3364330 RepID=UPI0037C94A16